MDPKIWHSHLIDEELARKEFLVLWSKYIESEDRLDCASRAMGWNGKEVLSKDHPHSYHVEHHVVAANALLEGLASHIAITISSGLIKPEDQTALQLKLFDLAHYVRMFMFETHNGSDSFARELISILEVKIDAVATLYGEGNLTDDHIEFLAAFLNDILEICLRCLAIDNEKL